MSTRKLAERLGLARGAEFNFAVALFLFQVVCKIWDVFHYRIDSDESQHLHVIWGWTHGLLQYRDLFDNHMPLFHILCAPLLGLLGEHAADLYWMRLLMVPIYFLNAWCIFEIGRIAFSPRVGTWAAIVAGCISSYQFCSTEFRPDNFWTLCWLLSIIVLLRGPISVATFARSGLLLGLCFAVSMKTTLMFLAIICALTISFGLIGRARLHLAPPKLSQCAAALFVCATVPPAVVALLFAARGVWPQFSYCVFTHNVFLHPANRNTFLNPLAPIVGLPLLGYVVRQIIRRERDAIVAFRRAFVLLACGSFILVLRGLWRHLSREDYLPFYPLLALVVIAAVVALARRRSPRPLVRFAAPATVALLVMLIDLVPKVPLRNHAEKEVNMVRDVLALTDPDDYVVDCKGETVFRPRAFYYVLERLTLDRMQNGLIRDELAEQSIARRACLATRGGEMPPKDISFLRDYYISVGHSLRVAGCLLSGETGESIPFRIAIPAPYKIISPSGEASGLLDGEQYTGTRFLAAGEHEFRSAGNSTLLAVLWAKAAERNFTPFAVRPDRPLGGRQLAHALRQRAPKS